MKRFFTIVLVLSLAAAFSSFKIYAGGDPSCVGKIVCGGQKTYWTDRERELRENRVDLGGVARKVYPGMYRSGDWLLGNVVVPVLGNRYVQKALEIAEQASYGTPSGADEFIFRSLRNLPRMASHLDEVGGVAALGTVAAGRGGRATALEIAERGGRIGDLHFPGEVLGRGSGGTVFKGSLGKTPVAAKVYTAHNNPAVRAGQALPRKKFIQLEGDIIDEAMAAEILMNEGLGGVQYYGTRKIGEKTALLTNIIENSVAPVKAPSGLVMLSGEWKAAVEPQLREIAEIMYRKHGLLARDVQYGINAQGRVQLFDLNFAPAWKIRLATSQEPIAWSMGNMTFLGIPEF